METKMFILSLVMLSCIIQSSFALKCFSCDSISSTKCLDLSDKNIQAQECEVNSLVSQVGSLYSQISGNSKETPVPACLKTVSGNGTYTKVVSRSCVAKWPNQDPCVRVRNTLTNFGVNTQVASCDVCNDKDGCNSGNSMKMFFTLIVFATMASTARLLV